MICATLSLSVALTFSTSFVKRLISSPVLWRSKKRTGSAWSFTNSTSRISRTVFCATETIQKDCSHVVRAPTA